MSNYIELINGVYGYSDKSTKVFRGLLGDSEDSYDSNNKTQPIDWVYRKKIVEYEFNDNGHRTIELRDLPEEFILVTGCSHTEGIGLSAEDRYSDIISRELNIPVYNMGLAASGPDLIYHNLSLWFKHIKKIPKLIIIQHTYLNRAYTHRKGIIPLGPSWMDRIDNFAVPEENKDNFRNLLLSGYCEHYFHIMREMFNSFNTIPTIEIAIENIEGTILFEKIDTARDLSHMGIESNKLIAKKILKQL